MGAVTIIRCVGCWCWWWGGGWWHTPKIATEDIAIAESSGYYGIALLKLSQCIALQWMSNRTGWGPLNNLLKDLWIKDKSLKKHFLRKVKVSLWAHCQSDWFPYSVLDLKKTYEMKQNKTKHAEFSNVSHFHFLSLLTWKYNFLCLKLTVHKRRQSLIGIIRFLITHQIHQNHQNRLFN